MTRIYQPVSLVPHTTLLLDKKASHHVAMVLRMRVGETLYVFNGVVLGDFEATILQVNKKGVLVKLNHFIPKHTESQLKLTLAQGIARGEKMDFIIQKAVELGVSTIVPLLTERSNVKLDAQRAGKKKAHWQSVIISACEQSGRVQIPLILPMISLNEWFDEVKNDTCFVLTPYCGHPFDLCSSKPTSVAVLIGPEGGLSENELSASVQHAFTPITLGPRILRTETASIAALTLLQYAYGCIDSAKDH